jgi:salicylate hydroxylase
MTGTPRNLPRDIAICGCGPAGLAAALLLHRALLDALALARALDSTPDLPRALQTFAAMRSRHTHLFQWASATFTPFYQSDSRLLPLIRDWLAAPLSRLPVADTLLARLVSGTLTAPLARSDFRPWRPQ